MIGGGPHLRKARSELEKLFDNLLLFGRIDVVEFDYRLTDESGLGRAHLIQERVDHIAIERRDQNGRLADTVRVALARAIRRFIGWFE